MYRFYYSSRFKIDKGKKIFTFEVNSQTIYVYYFMFRPVKPTCLTSAMHIHWGNTQCHDHGTIKHNNFLHRWKRKNRNNFLRSVNTMWRTIHNNNYDIQILTNYSKSNLRKSNSKIKQTPISRIYRSHPRKNRLHLDLNLTAIHLKNSMAANSKASIVVPFLPVVIDACHSFS